MSLNSRNKIPQDSSRQQSRTTLHALVRTKRYYANGVGRDENIIFIYRETGFIRLFNKRFCFYLHKAAKEKY